MYAPAYLNSYDAVCWPGLGDAITTEEGVGGESRRRRSRQEEEKEEEAGGEAEAGGGLSGRMLEVDEVSRGGG